MILSRITYHDADAGRCYEWFPTIGKARARAGILRLTGCDVTIEKIDFPETKRGVARWLDKNFSKDNG